MRIQESPQDIVRHFADAFWDDPGLFAKMVYDSGDRHGYDVDEALAVIEANPEWSALLKEGLEEIDLWRMSGTETRKAITALQVNLESQLNKNEKPRPHPHPQRKKSRKPVLMLGTGSPMPLTNAVEAAPSMDKLPTGFTAVFSVVARLKASVTTGMTHLSSALRAVNKLLLTAYANMVQRETVK